MHRYWTKLFWLAAAAGLVGAIAYGLYPDPIPVQCVRPVRGVLEVTVDDDGETRIREKYVVSAPVGGKMQRVELRPGDRVVQGETELTRINPVDPVLLDARTRAEAVARVRATEASLMQAQAAVTRAAEAMELADHDYQRARQLVNQSAISRAEFDAAEHRVRLAKVDLRSAEFGQTVAEYELEQAKAALSYTESADDGDSPTAFRVIAPVDGLVLNVLREDASVVSAGTPLLELGDPRDMEMRIDVLSSDAVRVRPGNKVYVEHWGGDETLQGVVRLVEPAAFLKISALGVEEKRVNVIADFTDPPQRRETLGDGFRIEVRIVVEAASDTALKIPAGVLFRNEGQWSLFRAVDGVAELRQVRVGLSNGLETEILDGISDHDVLIQHPPDSVQPGTRVTAIE